MKKLSFLLFLLLASCSTRPAFRKLEKGSGYEAREGFTNEMMEISAALPAGTEAKFAEAYLLRAGGEECLQRGFSYFAYARTSETSLKIVCSPQPERRTLGLVFDPKASLANPPQLRVTDTLMGSHSPLKSFDLVKKIGGHAVSSPGEFLERETLLGKEGRRSVAVQVERSEIVLNLEATLVEKSEGMIGPERLQKLRSEVP